MPHQKNPPPPAVGTLLEGPATRHETPGIYEVRAVVDNIGEDPTYGWFYHLVLRWARGPKKSHGWRYEIVDSFALGVGLFKPHRATPTKTKDGGET